MKKIFLTSALAISMIVPSFAETTAPDIAAGAESATCDSGTLNTTDGTSTLSAQWTANTITLKFYSDDTTTPFATNTCTYDGGITLPASAPQRVGYNFAGWQVKQNLINLSEYYLIGENETDSEEDYLNRVAFITINNLSTTEFSTFGNDLNIEEWKVKFSNGTVKGKSKCSNTTSDVGNFGTPSDIPGSACWCSATNYDVGNINVFYNVFNPVWVNVDDNGTTTGCQGYCARTCADVTVFDDAETRKKIFGITE